MALRNIENILPIDESGHVSEDSGYSTRHGESLEYDNNTEASSSLRLTIATGNVARDRRLRRPRSVVGRAPDTSNASIAVPNPNPPRISNSSRTSDISSTLSDQAISAIRHALNQPSLGSNGQRRLRSMLDNLLARRQTIRNPLRDIALEIIWRYTSPPTFGPHRRPLNLAAVRQNSRARTRRAYTAALEASGRTVPPPPTQNLPPIRYGDTYDNLLGRRSLDDGTAAAYAERMGNAATYAALYSSLRHNGLMMRRGHLHITTADRYLVEARQARALAGLSTADMDAEIAYRMEREMDCWGWLGQCVRESGWVRRTGCFCEAVGCRSRRITADALRAGIREEAS